jgi:hypothetical protein
LTIVAGVRRRGGLFTPAERRIAIDRFGAGVMRSVNGVIGIRRERLPFVEFVDADGSALSGSAVAGE